MTRFLKTAGLVMVALIFSACIIGGNSDAKIKQETITPPAKNVQKATQPAAKRTAAFTEASQAETETPLATDTLATQVPVAATLPPIPTEPLGMGSSRISDKDGIKQVFVPAGKFQMGSSDFGNVQPHTVNLDAFWIDQTDVTNAMYAKCVSAGSCKPHPCTSDCKFYGDRPPVVWVDWNMADSYCKWAGRSLPTEAQWEKAARGTDGRAYPWGNHWTDKSLLNYNFNVDKTTDVGSYPTGASPYGALDMAGNVWQWEADWYGSYYSNSPQNNPTGPTSGSTRVVRGGSWQGNSNDTHSAFRSGEFPSAQGPDLGFRCAVRAAPSK